MRANFLSASIHSTPPVLDLNMSDLAIPKRKKSTTKAPEDGPSRKRSKREHDPPNDKKDKKKKKKKERENETQDLTSAPDPSQDTQLSERAREALAYVYQWKEARDQWKFSKSTQKWLLKNFFEEDQVPAAYETLCAAYLSTVEGLSKRRLVSFCQEQSVKDDEENKSADIRRAKMLLPSLSTPDEQTNDKT